MLKSLLPFLSDLVSVVYVPPSSFIFHMNRCKSKWDIVLLCLSGGGVCSLLLYVYGFVCRLRCPHLKSLTLSDGEYYELVKSNFERADRKKVVRTTTNYTTSIVSLLTNYNDLLFN